MRAFVNCESEILIKFSKLLEHRRFHTSFSNFAMESVKLKRQHCDVEILTPGDAEEIANFDAEPKHKKGKMHAGPSTSIQSGSAVKKRFIESKPLENAEIYVENGLRKVRPYWFKYMTSTKQRWEKQKLVDVLHKEFHGKNEDFFNVAIKLGRLKVNDKMTSLDHVLGPLDVLTNIAHRHELPVLAKSVEILVNNQDVLVINKPCSIPVHPCGRYFFNSMTQILKSEHNLTDLKLMYRLDRLTSGLVIMSKHAAMDLKLKSEIVARTVQKEYVCLVDGEFPRDPVECTESLEPCEPKMGVQWISANGKECVTKFELVATNGKLSVVRCMPKTGRTHQIRVHLQYLGFPICNDYMYNNTVWGPNKGKGAEYGKSADQLKKDLLTAFGAENWVVDFEESRSNFMDHKEKLVESIDNALLVDPNSVIWTEKPSSTVYDPYCIDCHVTSRIPSQKDLQMYLHCLKYKGSDWEYETPLPVWAKKFYEENLSSNLPL